MNHFFYNPEIHFKMWGTSHLVVIFLSINLILVLFLFKKRLFPYRHVIRITVGSALILSRISLDFWYIQTGEWDIGVSLPLELCSIASLMCGVMLLTKSERLFEVFYFIAIGGAIQAILTPSLDYGFPQFRFFQFFIDHFLLILAPLIMIALYEYRVTIGSVLKAFITINLIAIAVFFINISIPANYMFLRHKPATPSLLDLLGDYPWYLLSLQGVTIAVFLILYVPFAFNFLLKRK